MLRAAVLLGGLAACGAEVINVEANASYAAKIHTGARQALSWIADMVVFERPPRPPRKVEVAVVGFGRTGSTSFSAALKDLGYAPVHDDEAMEVADIYKAILPGTMSMDQINDELGKRGFDVPMVPLHKYVEWLATRPDIKVVLTVRDKRKWAESYTAIAVTGMLPEWRPFCWIQAIADLTEFNRELVVNVPTNGHPELLTDLPTLEAGYDAWVDFVRRTVPKERLLEFNVKQGWEPLCAFLGKPVPAQPFPHINDRVVVDAVIKVFVLIAWIWPLLFASPLLLLWCCCRRCCRPAGGAQAAASEAKKRA